MQSWRGAMANNKKERKKVAFTAENIVLIDQFHNLIYNDPRYTAKDFGELLNCSTQQLCNALATGQRADNYAVPRLDWLIPAIRKSNNFKPLDYIEASLNRFAIPLPEREHTTEEILEVMSSLGKEVGDIYDRVNRARHPDSPGGVQMTKTERVEAMAEVLDVQRILQELYKKLGSEEKEAE